MNSFKVLINNSGIANGLKNLYKTSLISSNVVGRVRTPFNFNKMKLPIKTEINQNRFISNEVSKKIQNLFPKLTPQRELHDTTAIPLKKRPGLRKKRNEVSDQQNDDGYYSVMAFATAEEYNLEKLIIALKTQDLYETKKFFTSENQENEPDVLYVTAKYQVGVEPRDIYFFREGTVVFWNCTDLESSNILGFLKNFEQDSYDENIVQDESEFMFYNYAIKDPKPALRNNNFYITKTEDNMYEKYTFSNSLSLSVKLGIWEASLDQYVDSMAYVTEDLKHGNKIKITRPEMLRKTGELFALRHLINLSSDLLDTPDFYWDREQLEALYSVTCNYFSIPRRTRVMNEKLNHCLELADLITSNLNDDHHVRLEWMIIILIMVEVGFEVLHYGERFYN